MAAILDKRIAVLASRKSFMSVASVASPLLDTKRTRRQGAHQRVVVGVEHQAAGKF